MSVQREKATDVRWDAQDRSWRIWVHLPNAGMNGQPQWWPLRWLRFATPDAARQHLELRGAW